eukprot:snap_masked-scaffold_6-processed-gene-18.16-mRNA-1 protein AED:0.42 eAED:0.43 QI:0/-1/0/1/-1/1/1/0/145
MAKDSKAVSKAKNASNAARGSGSARTIKTRTSTRFYRPKTLILKKNPKYARTAIASKPRLDKFKIIQYPLTTETAMKKIEDHNTLVFIVHTQANKIQIKRSVEDMYGLKVQKVNTLIRPDAKKKAFVRLTPDYDALDVANRIGII